MKERTIHLMSRSIFETLVTDEMNAHALASMKCLGDSVTHALRVGQFEGLKRSIELFRQAQQEDMED